MYEFMILLFMVGIFIFVCHIYKILNIMWDMFKTKDYMEKWLNQQSSNKK